MALPTENNGLCIDGDWARPLAGGNESALNPVTEEVIGMASRICRAEVDQFPCGLML